METIGTLKAREIKIREKTSRKKKENFKMDWLKP